MTVPAGNVTQSHAKLEKIGYEFRALFVLSDMLLPKVISGELRLSTVPEPTSLCEDAVSRRSRC